MNRGAENYYLILELDFLKPEEDMQVIRDRIREKGSYWNANCEKGPKEQQARFRKYKDQLMQIQKVMTEPGARRKEAEDAAAYVREKLGEELKFFAGQKELGEKEAAAVMKRCGLWREMFLQMSGMKILAEKEKGENPNPDPPKKNRFTASVAALKLLGKQDLYDFLVSEGEDWYDIRRKNSAELLKRAHKIWDSVKYQPPSDEQTQVGNLYALCQEVFDPGETKLREYYDQFIVWQQRAAVISKMIQYAGDSKFLNANMKSLFVDELTKTEGDRETARDRFCRICEFHELHFEGSAGEGESVSAVPGGKFIDCAHCFTKVDVSHGEKKCSRCGRDLYVICPNPKCKKEIPASSRACSFCGCKLENLGKTENLLRDAREAMDRMEFAAAGQILNQAEKLLPGYRKTEDLRVLLHGREKDLSAEVTVIEDLADKKEFKQAALRMEAFYRRNPGAKLDKEALIRNSLKDADQLFARAMTEKEEDQVLELAGRILRICSDYPVESLIGRYPPGEVTGLEACSDPESGSIELVWEKSPGKGEITYRVLRKKGAASAGAEDGEILGMAGTTRFRDQNTEPGEEYYYTVYAVRAGVLSRGCHVCCVSLKEIALTGTDVGSGFVRISWKPVSGKARVKICRKDNGEPKDFGDGEILEPGNDYLLDTRVENDKTYGYRLGIVYPAGGKYLVTEGVAICCTPGAMPDPVTDLSLVCLEGGIFEARWTPGKDKTVFFCTEGEVREEPGEAVSLGTLQKEYRPAVLLKEEPGKCRLDLSDTQKCSVIPVTLKEQTGIVGVPAGAVVMEKINIGKVEPVNGRLQLELDWPSDAVTILVLSHPSRYPEEPGDRTGAKAVSVTKKQYEAHGVIALPDLEAREYFLSLFSCSRVNGELVYSPPTHVHYNNTPKADIEYAVSVTGFFRNKKALIRFRSSAEVFELPEIHIISRRDGQPVYANSGDLLLHIDARTVQGSYEAEIPLAGLAPRTYIKAFFVDETLYDEIQLRMAYGSQAKIS